MSDRGHWLRCARNAWQKLGNMSPEVAMEQYIDLLSDRVPGWTEDKFAVSLLLFDHRVFLDSSMTECLAQVIWT